MKSMFSTWIYSGFNSDHWITYTHEWNFAPSFAVAQASFYTVVGAGSHHTGIAGYRSLPDPAGSEIPVSLGDWPSWPPYIYVDQLTSVTFGVAVGAEQEASVLVNVFFW
jgi:hypothetical protein